LEGQGWEPSFGQGDLNERREKVSNKRKKIIYMNGVSEGKKKKNSEFGTIQVVE